MPHKREREVDNPALTVGQEAARWALPVLYESYIATGIDAVFVHDGERWRAITGLDRVIDARIRARAPDCAFAMARLDPQRTKRCSEVAWLVADAALRAQAARLTHACTLAANACGKPAP